MKERNVKGCSRLQAEVAVVQERICQVSAANTRDYYGCPVQIVVLSIVLALYFSFYLPVHNKLSSSSQ